MKDELYEILGELTEIRYQVEAMNYILRTLAETFETKNQMEETYLVQLFIKYGSDLEQAVANISYELDKTILKYK